MNSFYKHIKGVCLILSIIWISCILKYNSGTREMLKLIFNYFVLLAAAYTDIREKKIKNSIMVTGLMGNLIFIITGQVNVWHELSRSMWSGLVWLVVTMLISAMSKHSIGWGDAKLFFMLGFGLGIGKCADIFVVTFIMAGIAAVVVWLVTRDRKLTLPMGPFVWGAYYCIVLLNTVRI